MQCRCGRPRDRPDRVRCAECRERPKRQVFEAYGGPICIYCGCEDFDALNLEHRHNDGNVDKRRGYSGQKLYRLLRAQGYPQGRFDVACANCNIIKQIQGVDYLLKLRQGQRPSILLVLESDELEFGPERSDLAESS